MTKPMWAIPVLYRPRLSLERFIGNLYIDKPPYKFVEKFPVGSPFKAPIPISEPVMAYSSEQKVEDIEFKYVTMTVRESWRMGRPTGSYFLLMEADGNNEHNVEAYRAHLKSEEEEIKG